MHTTRSPSASIQTGAAGDVLDLSLTGSLLTVGRRPSSASPGKHFSRSISVSVTDAGLGGSRAIKNLRRSNSTTQVNQQANTSRRYRSICHFFACHFESFDSCLESLSLLVLMLVNLATCILNLNVFVLTFRSNKAAVGNSVTTILHNNHSEKPLTPKSSNQKPSFNNIIKATVNDDVTVDVSCSLTKSQKNFSSASSSSNNNAPHSPRSPGQPRRREVTEEEAERYIQQVNHAAITIQRWYRRHANRKRANVNTIKHLLISKKKEREQRAEEEKTAESLKKKEDDRKRIREEKARLARLTAIQVQQSSEIICRTNYVFSGILSQHDSISCEDKMNTFAHHITSFPQEILQRSVSMEDQRQGASSSRAQSKTTLNDLLDTLKLLEEEPERLSEPKSYRKDKYAWIDEDEDSNSLTTDNVERHRQLSQTPALPDGGALLSEAKLQSIMSFLDEMEKSEQERPRSVTSGSHREVSIYELTAEVTSSMMKLKLELDEKKRTVNMLQTALAQQRELTIRHVKETEKELNHTFQLQKQQYEATIQRHLTFIDQLIDDKKALSERCEEVVGELKQVDQKYTKKIAQMQEQHEMDIKKLKELMSATEKFRREKWIDEKTKKIKEITVKGLEPEIQKLITKHKQELKKLRVLHEAELLQADERAAQRYVRQTEELRQQLESERDEQCQRERELAKQRFEKQLQEEENALQQQRRRLYKEVSEEKERITQLAARQHAELEDLRKQLEKNSSLAARALREELEKSREEQERRHQVKHLLKRPCGGLRTLCFLSQEAWLLSRERELKEEVRRGRDKEIELAIQRLEEETRGAREECERAADNRIKRVREKYEAELRDLERLERAALQKQQEMREKHSEMEAELLRLQSLLRQREQEISDLTRARDKLSDERRSLAEVIRQEFAERLVETEEENRRMKMEVSEAKARLRLEVERVTREKEEELAEVHQRSEAKRIFLLVPCLEQWLENN
uniref:Centrosomal protein 131 n=1 Tax=Sinocyclocheilus rhinocerous TaxID=307959 RepID=A0A673HRV5_9TELE